MTPLFATPDPDLVPVPGNPYVDLGALVAESVTDVAALVGLRIAEEWGEEPHILRGQYDYRIVYRDGAWRLERRNSGRAKGGQR